MRFLHAVGAFVALIAPIGCIEQTLTTIVAVKFSEAVGKAAYVNFEKLADGKTGNTVSEAFIVPQTMEN